MAWKKKGTKVLQVPLPESIYSRIEQDAKSDVLHSSKARFALKIIVEYYQEKDKAAEKK